jgi:transcriptional regulator with XRE-family HTH domain
MSSQPSHLVTEARLAAGLSRSALARKAGVPTSTISRIEEGLIDPTFGTLARVLAAAGSTLAVERVTSAPPTLASLVTAVDASGPRLKIDWTRLRSFADWAARHRTELDEAIADPPMRTGTALDAILAAFAEELAGSLGRAVPRWTKAVLPLEDLWEAPGTPAMRARARANTPAAFLRRNVILERGALLRDAA